MGDHAGEGARDESVVERLRATFRAAADISKTLRG
jgi:hypothetical protein